MNDLKLTPASGSERRATIKRALFCIMSCAFVMLIVVLQFHPSETANANPIWPQADIPPTYVPAIVPTTAPAVIDVGEGRPFSGIQQAWLRFLLALLLAWLVEIPVILIMTRVLFGQRAFSIRRVILLGLLMTLITLPILWFVLPGLLSPSLYIVIGETLVVLAEAAILKFGLNIGFADALLMSLAANAASFVAGLLLL